MNLEQDYVKYAIEFSLSLLAISAAYFFNPSDIMSYGTLMLVPVLLGYTAFISREGFDKSSLMVFITFFLAPLSLKLTALAALITMTNVLVSWFAGGDSFKEFYHATTIPLLLIGLIVGTAAYGATTTNPDFGAELTNTTADYASAHMKEFMNETKLGEIQQNAQMQVIDQTSYVSIKAAEGYVLNDTRGKLSNKDLLAVQQSFREAEQKIPEKISSTAEQRMDEAPTTSDTIGKVIRQNLGPNTFVLLIPFATLSLYGLQPILGFLTAISAFVFRILSRD